MVITTIYGTITINKFDRLCALKQIPFYYQDFLVGTEFMADEDTGKYIKMLCYQADKGKLTKKQVCEAKKCFICGDYIKPGQNICPNCEIKFPIKKRK